MNSINTRLIKPSYYPKFNSLKKLKTRIFHCWLHFQQHRKGKPVIRRPQAASIKVTEQGFKYAAYSCSLCSQLWHVMQANCWPEFRASSIYSVYSERIDKSDNKNKASNKNITPAVSDLKEELPGIVVSLIDNLPPRNSPFYFMLSLITIVLEVLIIVIWTIDLLIWVLKIFQDSTYNLIFWKQETNNEHQISKIHLMKTYETLTWKIKHIISF